MVLAIILLILASITTAGTVINMAAERQPGKRVLTLVFSTVYVVVMVLSALALLNG